MAAPADVISFLKSAFSQPETDYLMQQTAFVLAVGKALSFDDCERFCYTGQNLLDLRTSPFPRLPALRSGSVRLPCENHSAVNRME